MGSRLVAPVMLDGRFSLRGPAFSLFHPERIALAVRLGDKQRAFQEIGRLLRRPGGPSTEVIADRLARREARGSTALGHGAALPHAHVAKLPAPMAVYLRDERGIAYDAPDGLPVSQILALLVPWPASAAHYELLVHVTRRFSTASLRADLACQTSPQQIHELLCRKIGA